MSSPRNGRRRSSLNYAKNSSIKLHSSMADRRKAKRNNRAAAKAEYLSTLPKERWKRFLYRLQPKRVAAYWFSREGGIMALKLIGIGIVVCFFLTVGLFAYFRKDLPKIKDISGGSLGGSVTYYDRTGQTVLWQDYDAVKRIPVKSDEISDYLKHATIAIEDKNFYNEGAFDVRGIMRAGFNDLTNAGSGNLQGGSTITQQLVKLNQQWTNDRTVSRKVKELILAVELEREYSKDDILTGYLNIAPYAGLEFGAESASQDFFHTSAKNLTLAQASLMAAIPQAPGRYSPYTSTRFNPSAKGTFNETALIDRQHYILDLMVQQGYVTREQADAAKQVAVLDQIQPLSSKYNGIKAPYFVLAAKNELEDRFGAASVKLGGWKVITTLDMGMQADAEKLTAQNAANVKRYGGDTQAIALEDVKTGQMRVLVGGEEFSDPNSTHGKLNYAQLNISPGSSFKPYDYATFIENRTDAGAGSVLYDVQEPLPGYPCTNKKTPKEDPTGTGHCLFDYDLKYPGPESLRYAIGGSRNVPAVKAMLSATPNDTSQGRTKSINKVISTANSMMGDSNAYKCYKQGVEDVQIATRSDQTQCYGSSAIGDGAYLHLDEHTNGLSTFARMGQAIPQTYILQITDSANKDFYKWTQPKSKQVVRPDTAYIINDMLSDPKASYLTAQRKIQNYNGWKIAVKTGTTANNFDGLMASWTTQYAIVSWVGYHTRTKAITTSMEGLTGPLTQSLMKEELNKLGGKPINWEQPADMKLINGYVQRTHVGNASIEPGPTQDLFPSWYVAKSGSNTSSTIDKVSGGTATSCTPAAAKQTVGGANDNSFSADDFYPVGKKSGSAAASAPTSSDTVHNCDDAKPSVTLTAPQTCSSLDNSGQGCQITVTASQGTHPLGGGSFGGTVQLSVNGADAGSQAVSNSPSTVTFYYKPTSTGSATVTATVTDSVLYQTAQSVNISLTADPQTGMTAPRQQATLANAQPRTPSTSGGNNNANQQRRHFSRN